MTSRFSSGLWGNDDCVLRSGRKNSWGVVVGVGARLFVAFVYCVSWSWFCFLRSEVRSWQSSVDLKASGNCFAGKNSSTTDTTPSVHE